MRAKRVGIKILTEILRKISQEENVQILDLYKFKLDDQLEKELLETYVHFTPKGCDFFSDHMANAILKNNLIEF